ncbi:DNA cytosine methyltransferase [Herbiconiux daphne]|uniref:DNA cytosine methyltransferase n=1 Tax=Herbiconiux daphne TaxID=2970914 RepID=UPI0038B3A661
MDGVSKTLRAGDCEQENKIAYQRIPFNDDSKFVGVVGLCPTLVATNPDFKNKILYNFKNTIFYRPLTPRECLLLMGFESSDYDRLKQAGVSDAQICKQCGNSIVVNVLEAILKIILRKLVE